MAPKSGTKLRPGDGRDPPGSASLSHQGAGEFSRKLFRNGAASKTPEQVITFVVIVSVREVGYPNAALIVKGVHRI